MKYIILILVLVSGVHQVKADTVDPQLRCLAKNIYHEARGESFEGQVAIAIVTLNRVKSKHYPNTICKVVYQKYQFSWAINEPKIKNWRLYHKIKDLAHSVMTQQVISVVGNSEFYYSKKIKAPYWTKGMNKVAVIDNHIFLKKENKMINNVDESTSQAVINRNSEYQAGEVKIYTKEEIAEYVKDKDLQID